MKKSVVAILIVVMLLVSAVFLHWSGLVQFKPIELNANSFPKLQTLALNKKGNALFAVQSYKAAFEQYVAALEYDPFSAPLHLNIGLTYEAEQQTDKAISSYQNAFQYADDGLTKFMALFNQAQIHGKAKKYDEALNAYQQALKLNPASKEVKTNIELLIQAQQQEQKQDDQSKDGDKKDDKPNDSQDPKDQNKDSKDGKSPKDDKKEENKKDPKDDKNKGQQEQPKPEDKKEEPKPEDKPDDKEKDSEKKPEDQPKTPAKNEKYKPRPFNGKELSEADVKKILGEIKQQEQKIRSEFNRKDVKEQARDKDW